MAPTHFPPRGVQSGDEVFHSCASAGRNGLVGIDRHPAKVVHVDLDNVLVSAKCRHVAVSSSLDQILNVVARQKG